MKCYITGDDCNCGNTSMDDQCPHDEYGHENDDDYFDPFDGPEEPHDLHAIIDMERRDVEMMEKLDAR